MSKNLIIMTALAFFAGACPAWAEDECPSGNIQGAWLAHSNFSAGGLVPVCSRVYVCVSQNEASGQSTMSSADCRRVYTNPPARRTVNGVCSAGGGAVDSCNACLTAAPSDACEYHYEHS
jgi:hypothetical protein